MSVWLFTLFLAFAYAIPIDQRVKELMAQMTVEEKVGQLNQYNDGTPTGPVNPNGDIPAQIRKGQVGSLLNVMGVERTSEYQKIALESRLKIPLIFGQDVIHGYKATFPIPLAEASSWDMEAIETSARIAAAEASASGIHWTFAPMVDIARDPRWGRVMEGAGEDVFLGSMIAKTRVKGFQGPGLKYNFTLMATAKHFAAYGAAIGGRDYNSVDMSLHTLWEDYLPPFKAAVDAGVGTLMNSFNSLNGIPATGSRYLQRTILKGIWNFSGFVVSDWNSIGEMIPHGYVEDSEHAALAAITAGNDMDMESRCYHDNLANLVQNGDVDISLVDAAVSRVLTKKFELGLFDDPFKNCDYEREKRVLNDPAHLLATRQVAQKSIVLMKNDNNVLPLSKNTKTVAFIGPMVKVHKANMGFWSIDLPNVDYDTWVISQWDGVKNALSPDSKLLYAEGCGIENPSTKGFQEAIDIAKQADVILLSIGERWNMTGEAKSRANIGIPGVQEDLLKAIYEATEGKKPIVAILNAGRPLVFNWTAEHIPAILYTWWLGTQAGNALADVLFGDVNPSAKLPISFPRAVGQVPIYYNHLNTGRPPKNATDNFYVSAYIDLLNGPKFPFGHGLSYSKFSYSNFRLSSQRMKQSGCGRTTGDTIIVTGNVSNVGSVAGAEVVQLYLRDRVASVVRPVKQLKGFEKIMLKGGETKEVVFTITNELLCFFSEELVWISEVGKFDVFVGSSSEDIRFNSNFELIK